MDLTQQALQKNPALYFIVNPASHSGKGEQLWKQAEQILRERGVPYEAYLSQKRGDIAEFANRLTCDVNKEEERFIVVLGGDGTVNEAMQGIHNLERIRLGYIPTGSSNDLARDLGIGGDIRQSLDSLLSGKRVQRMDVGSVFWTENGAERKRRFLVACGIGYDAAVCQEALSSKMKDLFNRLGLGKLTYLGIGLKQMITAPCVRAVVTLDGKEKLQLERMLFIASMTHRFEGGGFCFCPQANPQDGLLDLCVVNNVPKWKLPAIIPFALKGKHGRFNGVTFCRASRIEIDTSAPMWVQTDGEIPGKLSHIRLTYEKQKLRFFY